MHISSLPSPFGIGTFGKAAYEFIDFLSTSGQSIWQVLPLSPTGYGDSPYQSFSSFAGNPYFIDLEYLEEDGLLKRHEYEDIDWGEDPLRVDYGKIYSNRFVVLKAACTRLLSEMPDDLLRFFEDNAFWLDDYSLFMSLKNNFGGKPWFQWSEDLRNRAPQEMDRARHYLCDEIAVIKATQYLFFKQWNSLHSYAKERGVEIIGDIPIYVAYDSCEVWAEPQLFVLGGELCLVEVAGCPPDRHTADGQLWGNPLYKWDIMRSDGFSWWIRRIAHQFNIYDYLRLDHFRGFDAYYSIPFPSENAKVGEWKKGPGMELFNALNNAIGLKRYIAEDLGYMTDSVRELLRDSGFPGMKILQYAFGSHEDNDHLPHNYVKNCSAYTGSHDNDTIRGWFDGLSDDDAKRALDYMRIREGDSLPRVMISTLWASVADLVIATMQDVLELGSESRMNIPGTRDGNWQWRMSAAAISSDNYYWLQHITKLYGRL